MSMFKLYSLPQASGLSQWLGDQLAVFGDLDDWLMVLVLGLLVTIITQFTSNVATATLLLPIAASMVRTDILQPFFCFNRQEASEPRLTNGS